MVKKLNIGDIIDLDWSHGCGHGKVVGIYAEYATIIHPCSKKPFVVHFDNLELVKPIDKKTEQQIIDVVVKNMKESGVIRQAIQEARV